MYGYPQMIPRSPDVWGSPDPQMYGNPKYVNIGRVANSQYSVFWGGNILMASWRSEKGPSF